MAIAVCIIVNMKFKAETMIVTRKNLFIKEPTALKRKMQDMLRCFDRFDEALAACFKFE